MTLQHALPIVIKVPVKMFMQGVKKRANSMTVQALATPNAAAPVIAKALVTATYATIPARVTVLHPHVKPDAVSARALQRSACGRTHITTIARIAPMHVALAQAAPAIHVRDRAFLMATKVLVQPHAVTAAVLVHR